ncbi:MAG: hypothetical protein ACTSXL_04195 [Alphaproteobacteria bacterium]
MNYKSIEDIPEYIRIFGFIDPFDLFYSQNQGIKLKNLTYEEQEMLRKDNRAIFLTAFESEMSFFEKIYKVKEIKEEDLERDSNIYLFAYGLFIEKIFNKKNDLKYKNINLSPIHKYEFSKASERLFNLYTYDIETYKELIRQATKKTSFSYETNASGIIFSFLGFALLNELFCHTLEKNIDFLTKPVFYKKLMRIQKAFLFARLSIREFSAYEIEVKIERSNASSKKGKEKRDFFINLFKKTKTKYPKRNDEEIKEDILTKNLNFFTRQGEKPLKFNRLPRTASGWIENYIITTEWYQSLTKK